MSPAQSPTGPPVEFASWVEWRVESARRGRRLVTALSHRDGIGYVFDVADLDERSRRRSEVLGDLASLGFLPGSASPPAGFYQESRFQAGVVWKGADSSVRALYRRTATVWFSRAGIVAQVVLAMVGLVAFVQVCRRDGFELGADPGSVPAIIALGLAFVAVHELGHAFVTVHYGRSVRGVGLRLHLGTPAFYVDSVDALLLTRRQRLLQAAAGPWAEWLATSLLAVLVLSLEPGSWISGLLLRFVVINTVGLAMNLLPFVGLDGALLLADFVGWPDLSDRARDALRGGPCRPSLLIYALANAAVATGLLASSLFFWWHLFAELFAVLWHHGPVGVTAVVVLCGVVAYDMARSVLPTMRAAVTWAARTFARLRFRCQRRWRVEAIHALRLLPELESLGATELGVLAGRLERRRGWRRWDPDGHSYVYIRRTSRAPWRRRASTRCPHVATAHEALALRKMRVHDHVLLPASWVGSNAAAA